MNGVVEIMWRNLPQPEVARETGFLYIGVGRRPARTEAILAPSATLLEERVRA